VVDLAALPGALDASFTTIRVVVAPPEERLVAAATAASDAAGRRPRRLLKVAVGAAPRDSLMPGGGN